MKQSNELFSRPSWPNITPNTIQPRTKTRIYDLKTLHQIQLRVRPAVIQSNLCNLTFYFLHFPQAPFLCILFDLNTSPSQATRSTRAQKRVSPPPTSNQRGQASKLTQYNKARNSFTVNYGSYGILENIPGSVMVSGSLCRQDTTRMLGRMM